MMQVNNSVIQRISAVDSEEEFSDLLDSFRMSDALPEIKLAAIRELRTRKREFDKEFFFNNEKALKEIEAGQADIDDIN